MCLVTSLGFGLLIGFIKLLQTVTTRNDSAIDNAHSLQFTTANTKISPSAVVSIDVAWQRYSRA
jgi:hypothetical protein